VTVTNLVQNLVTKRLENACAKTMWLETDVIRWGFHLGNGCSFCNCSIASNSSQC